MSEVDLNMPTIESTEEKSESPTTVIAEPVDEDGIMAEPARDDEVEGNKYEELAAEFPLVAEFPDDEMTERQKASMTMNMPSLELSDMPSLELSDKPSLEPSDKPSLEPSDKPSLELLDKPSLELSDNDFNSTDSDSLTGRPHKNRTMEMKLSAIIEKACSSDVEAEDVAEAEPTLPVANVTVTLPNNQLLFTVEGVSVPPDSAILSDSQETAAPPAEPAYNVRPTRKKKYVYTLKWKGRATLRYTSYTPVVLKKPRIHLTRIDVGEIAADETNKNLGKRKAPTTDMLVNGKRSRGRPRKESALSATAEDTLDETCVKSNNESNSSFGMQTRKRKLRFLPDGRLMCVAKRRRSSSSSASSISDVPEDPPAKESTDEDWEASADDLRVLNASSLDKDEILPDKRKPPAKSQTPKSAKTATPKSAKTATPKSAKSGTLRSAPVASGSLQEALCKETIATPKLTSTKGVVNPAQLLTTLLGVTIRPSQLNQVRFKPKTLQKPHPSLQKTIVLTGDQLKGVAANLRASTGIKAAAAATSKPQMQKILPKSSLASFFQKTADTKSSPPTPSILSMALRNDLVSSPVAAAFEDTLPEEVPSFDDFTDSRTVRTKAGPKKLLLQQARLLLEEKLNRYTLSDLAQNMYDREPSWNLHVMPDTKTFCIAQVGRGRLGIPILRKSVELTDSFAAKIFVHQLHCKKFDGVYDTEAKINALIAEIDSLTA